MDLPVHPELDIRRGLLCKAQYGQTVGREWANRLNSEQFSTIVPVTGKYCQPAIDAG